MKYVLFIFCPSGRITIIFPCIIEENHAHSFLMEM
jgi:hypothetical protein